MKEGARDDEGVDIESEKREEIDMEKRIVSMAETFGFSHLSKECQYLVVRSDSCAAEALFMGSAEVPLIPRTPEQLDYYCGRAQTTFKCMIEYRKCLKLFPKTYFEIMIKTVKRTMNKICLDPKMKREVLHHLKCLDEETLPLLYTVMDGYTRVLDYVVANLTLSQVIPSLCCGYQYLTDDGLKLIAAECDPKTGVNSTGPWIMAMINSLSSDAVDLICGGYRSLSVCQARQPEILSTINQIITESRLPGRPKLPYTPVIPLLRLADKLSAVTL